MKEKYLHKLEFNQILDILSGFANTFIGKDLCLTLHPFSNKDDVEHALLETREATILLQRKGSAPISEIADIAVPLKVLKASSTLCASQLLGLANILKIARELKEYFSLDIGTEDTFSCLEHYFTSLYSNKSIEDNIFSCVVDENTIDDKASNELYKIRKQQLKTSQEIKEKLNYYLHSSKYTKYIQESITTIRNDRFVIPVKAEYRSEIKGLVHDISSTGSTVFIEPLSVFELNNSLNNLKLQEEIEIEKILQRLSSLFYSITDELEATCNIIGKIDFVFAKAKYGISINANEPVLSDVPVVSLFNARHPLIDSKKVVPINISIGENFSTLIITGPNTGGKTVAIKTVGLLSCMAMSGLFIPADEKSIVCPFNQIFVDIGDEQSIADSLSTFSSHMINIVEIVNNITANSLVLLDELGSGTDPVEGANLAISILEFLHSKKALTIVTTHYSEVKNYALVTSGFENASSEFDLNTLSPTYKLLLGVPGKSMAFAISEKLGLKKELLENAKSKMNNSQINIEELIKNIYDSKATIEKEKQNIISKSNEIEKLKQSLQTDLSNFEKQKLKIIDDAKMEARNILLDAKQEANLVLKELNRASSKSLNDNRNKLNEKIKSLSKSNEKQLDNKGVIPPENISVGMTVYSSTFGQNATVLSFPNKSGDVQIQIGNMKTKVAVSSLLKPTNIVNVISVPESHNKNSFSAKQVSSEINIIGQNVDEATFVIDKYLDDCYLAKLSTVRIVHGKGTGALRNGIHKFLKTHPHVKSFRIASIGEGDMGVTIVELY